MLDELLKKLQELPEDKQKAIEKEVLDATKHLKWIPLPGPQTQAYFSQADIMLYGGAAGGGKSDLDLGLAFTQHHQCLIMRRRYADLTALTDRAIRINNTKTGFTGGARPKLKTMDGRQIEFGACLNIGDEESWQGRPHDLLIFDEAVQFAEEQVRFLMTWNRPADGAPKGQRCRVVLSTNPPIGPQGQWIIDWFAPWLNPKYHNPAKPGELRWFITDERGKDVEVNGPDDGRTVDGKLVLPKSRTFIPAKLGDNPYQDTPSYRATLDALRPEMRAALRDGNFMFAIKDDPWQVIPTEWIREAQKRWTPAPPENIPMCAMGVDVAQGGEAETVLSTRYDYWFAPIISLEGYKTPRSQDVSGLVLSNRRDNATVVVDMGGGYGGGVYDHLKSNDIPVQGHKGSEKSTKRTVDGQLGFTNKRSEIWWKFREALDPSQPGGSPIALPDDPKLVADLTGPTFIDTPNGIKIEPKEDLVKRLGRSPDRGDAVTMCWAAGNKGINPATNWGHRQGRNIVSFNNHPKVVMGHSDKRRK